MKKLIKLCAILIAVSAILLSSWSGYRSLEGDTLQTYNRLHKGDSGEFTYWGLLSPFQSEAQSIVYDTVRFTHRVIYPVAPHFTLVEPTYSPEAQVAKEIMNVILDSLRRIEYDLSLDYDGQALAVRQYADPKTIQAEKPTVSLSLLGTASPEAIRYGLAESLVPGNYEGENDLLAKERLLRTRNILEKELPQSNIDFDLYFENSTSKELQLKNKGEVEKAILNPAILDTMRYVDADISIITQKVKITTATSPIALPFWIALFSFLLWKIYRWIKDISRMRYLRRYVNKPKRRFDLWWLILIIAALVIYFAFLLLFPVWVILIMMLAYLIYAIYTIYHYANFGMFWVGFITTILQIIDAIVRFIQWIRTGIVSIWNWWREMCGCCRFFIILSFILLSLWVTGVMHVTFVWPF